MFRTLCEGGSVKVGSRIITSDMVMDPPSRGPSVLLLNIHQLKLLARFESSPLQELIRSSFKFRFFSILGMFFLQCIWTVPPRSPSKLKRQLPWNESFFLTRTYITLLFIQPAQLYARIYEWFSLCFSQRSLFRRCCPMEIATIWYFFRGECSVAVQRMLFARPF